MCAVCVQCRSASSLGSVDLLCCFVTSCRDAWGQPPDAAVTQKMADAVLQLLDTLLANLHSKVGVQISASLVGGIF